MKRINLHSMWIRALVQMCLLMVLPVLLFTVWANYVAQESLLQQKRYSDLRSLQGVSSGITTLLESAEASGRMIAGSDAVRIFLADAQAEGRESYDNRDAGALLAPYVEASSHVIAASLMDPDGYFVGQHTLDRGRLSWYFTSLETWNPDTPFWTDPFSIQFVESGNIVQVLSVLVPVREGEDLLGYVVLYVPTWRMKRFLASIEDEVYILDQSTNIVASKQDHPFYINLYDVRRIGYNLLLENSSVIVDTADGKSVVTTHMFPYSRLQFVLVSSYDDIRDEAMHYPSIIAIGIYMVAFTALAAFVNARSVTKPVVRLKRVMDKARGGDLSVRYETRSQSEIADLGATFNSLLDNLESLLEEVYQQEETKRKMQLQLIQEQVRPHFLYNVLEMISSLVRDNLSEEALTALQRLARFYRISLNNGLDIIRIAQELELCESYLTLQQMRYLEFMDFTLSADPSIGECRIPKLTLQPIIENAIYHGLKGLHAKGMLQITGKKEEERVVFEVYDNGNGIAPEKLEEVRKLLLPNGKDQSRHFGMASVYRRLNLFFEGQAEASIDSREGEYTRVRISFPAVEDTTC